MKVKAVDSDSVSVSVHVLRDAALSLKAKGLLGIIIAWPAGEHLTMKALAGVCTDGRVALTAAWKELVDRGYLVEDPDGYRIAQNLPKFPGKVHVSDTSHPFVVEASQPILVAKATPVAALGSVRNRPSRTGGSVRNVQNVPSDPVLETDTSDGQKGMKPTVDLGDGVTLHTSGGNTSEEVGIDDDVLDLSSLLDGLTAEQREVTSRFELSWIGRFERIAPVLAEHAALGVDIRYYFDRIMSWSNKLKPKEKKNQRTVSGWIDTVRDAMARDNEQGKLRMVGTPQKKADLIDFLKIGHE